MTRYARTAPGSSGPLRWLFVLAACGGTPPPTVVNDVSDETHLRDQANMPADAATNTTLVSESDAEATRGSLGLETCDQTTTLPPVRFDNTYPTRRECRLAGEYDPANFCLVARALTSQGVTWTSPVILTREQSSKLIVRLRGLGMKHGGIAVNPRSSGEVMVHLNGELWSYCVEISPSEIALSLWMILSG